MHRSSEVPPDTHSGVLSAATAARKRKETIPTEEEVSRLRQALIRQLFAEKIELLQTEGLPSAADAWTFALHLEQLRRLETAQQRSDPIRLRKYLELASSVIAAAGDGHPSRPPHGGNSLKAYTGDKSLYMCIVYNGRRDLGGQLLMSNRLVFLRPPDAGGISLNIHSALA